MSGDPRVRAAIAAYFRTINEEDWDGLAALFHADAELRAPGTRPRVGGAAVASYYADALRPYPVHRDDPVREHYAGDVVTVEIRFDGELANGRPLGFDAVDVFDFRDGRVARLASWYDSQRVVAALLDAASADPPAGGGLEELTPARRRWALTRPRRGSPFHLGAGTWERLEHATALAARAVLLNPPPAGALDGAALDAAAASQGAALRPGDIVLVRTGGAPVALGDWAAGHGLAGVATDGGAAASGAGPALGAGWALDALAADCAAAGTWEGLLVSVPHGPGPTAANAAVFR
jgi:ketosteroid isomerase-like protein